MINKINIIKSIENGSLSVENIPAHYKDEKEIALAIALHSPNGLEHISFRLKNDVAFVRDVVNKHPEAIKYATKRVQDFLGQ